MSALSTRPRATLMRCTRCALFVFFRNLFAPALCTHSTAALLRTQLHSWQHDSARAPSCESNRQSSSPPFRSPSLVLSLRPLPPAYTALQVRVRFQLFSRQIWPTEHPLESQTTTASTCIHVVAAFCLPSPPSLLSREPVLFPSTPAPLRALSNEYLRRKQANKARTRPARTR